MRKYFLSFLAICLIAGSQVNAQGLLKKVSKSMTNELLGKPEDSSEKNKTKDQPEPACACDNAELVFELTGKLELDYTELSISMKEDGSLLVKNRIGEDYYIVKNGVTQGPYKNDDPKVTAFAPSEENDVSIDAFILRNKPYISKSGDKLLITFNGKTYGPYAQINNFVVTKSKEKFAAMVVENVAVTEDEGKKMEEAINNAKTEQEKMDLAMEYSHQMAQKIREGGGAMNTMPKLVTNTPDIDFDFLKSQGETLNGNVKYDEILLTSRDRIFDLNGNTIMTLKSDAVGIEDLFMNTDNTKYAAYNYGTLTFSDSSTMSDLFNPHLVKENSKVYLAYMYYSPKKNAILQCKIPF